ncbi:hypothetical protein [Pseudoalteromonas lipolytica]|nr:hypothetical protein [Pseudoalteromonas lipolytica]MBE0350904.1 hypothetical protein [Pseudoalteromonas lipolytica LMEB 39]
MPQLHAFNLCFQHANGKRLFNKITLSLTAKQPHLLVVMAVVNQF